MLFFLLNDIDIYSTDVLVRKVERAVLISVANLFVLHHLHKVQVETTEQVQIYKTGLVFKDKQVKGYAV
jgi:hypothetical protein